MPEKAFRITGGAETRRAEGVTMNPSITNLVKAETGFLSENFDKTPRLRASCQFPLRDLG